MGLNIFLGSVNISLYSQSFVLKRLETYPNAKSYKK